MTPVAYALKYLAGAIIYLADKFDEKVTYAITNTLCEGDVR